MATTLTSSYYAQHSVSIYALYTSTTTGTGDTLDLTAYPIKSFSVQSTGTGGTPTLWTAILEGSLDGSTFDTIITNTNIIGIGVLQTTGTTLAPVRYIRVRVTALTLGVASSLNINILGIS